MLSYHNDPEIKARYIARFEAHRAADEVVQGIGFAGGRGCFVGCTLDKYDHSQFSIELGWPEWLAHLADRIFEGLPKDEAAQFGSDLLAAVPVGVDLDPVRHTIAIKRMDRIIAMQNKESSEMPLNDVLQQVSSALQLVRSCHEAEINKTSCDWLATLTAARIAARSAEARIAACSAESVAWSKWSAAWSAARSAARSAASSAESVAWSAWSAARSAAWYAACSAARSVAWYAACSAAFQQERDDLLELLHGLAADR